MGIKLSGLASNMDTDSMVQDLVKAYSVKKDDMVKAQTKLQWKQDAWKTLNTKIHSFYNKALSNMRFSTNYNQKKTTISNDKIASITADETAAKGTQTLEVEKLAKAGYLTGGKLDSSVKGSTKLSELGVDFSGSSTAKLKMSVGGKETEIVVDQDTTINKLVEKMNDAGVTASFDSKNNRFFIFAPDSGEAKDFSLTAENATGLSALGKLGLVTADVATSEEVKKWAQYGSGGTDKDSIIASAGFLDEVEKYAGERVPQIVKQNEEMAKKITLFDENTAEHMKRIDSFKAEADYPTRDLSDLKDEKAALDEEIKNGKVLTEDEKADYNKLKTQVFLAEAVDLSNKAIQSNNEKVNQLNNSIAYNETLYTKDADGKATATNALKSIITDELVEKVQTAVKTAGGEGLSTTAVRVKGEDAKIKLNGADFTSSTNGFVINGLTISVKELTEGKPVSINTDTDYEGVYDNIKSFLKEYSVLMNEMNSLFGATSAKGYEPLTQEEKDSMSDKEIDTWEKKIKDSVLRKDGTLDSVTNVMQSAMMRSYEINGQTYSLAGFGINTQSYFLAGDNEKGTYYINGDSDSPADIAGEKNLLKSAIASDPATLTNFFQKLTKDMWGDLDKKMKSTKLNSIYSVYEDKKMQEDYNNYAKKIAEQEKKVKKIEDRYYKQFAAMETALSKMQSTQSSLSGLFGG